MRTKNLLKKLTAAVLTAGMFVTGSSIVAPQTVWAEITSESVDSSGTIYAENTEGFVFSVSKGATKKKGCAVLLYGGKETDITFPKQYVSSKYGTYQVTDIGEGWGVSLLTRLTSVTIPSGYTTIHKSAFENQSQLYKIVIPASVTKLESGIFSGCNPDRLTIVTPYGSAAEKYAIANGFHYTNSKSVQVKTGDKTMYAGENRKIEVYNASSVAWTSSNESVATVDETGCVTAKKAGSVKITAKIGSKTYSYNFKVLKRTEDNVLKVIWANYVTAGMSDYEKAVAANAWMEANVKPTGSSVSVKKAFEGNEVNYKAYTGAYKKILSHYKMKVKEKNGKAHLESYVTIAGKSYKASTLASSKADKNFTTTGCGNVTLNKSTMTIAVGKTGTFKASGKTAGITWSSSNKKVATVNKNGKVTGKSIGTATIRMKVNGKTYNCTVRVKK